MASFTKEVNLQLAKRPFIFNGRLANHRLISLVKEATGASELYPSAAIQVTKLANPSHKFWLYWRLQAPHNATGLQSTVWGALYFYMALYLWLEPQGCRPWTSILTITLAYYKVLMGLCKKDVTPLLTHWSYIFLPLTHRNTIDIVGNWKIKLMVHHLKMFQLIGHWKKWQWS